MIPGAETALGGCTPRVLSALPQGKYDGIRPAVGYPSIPDQRVMGAVWELLGLEQLREETRMWMTDSFGLSPEASIAGIALSHPRSSYFSVGRASREQVADYAERAACLRSGPAHAAHAASTRQPLGCDRKHQEEERIAETEKWLTAVLA